MTKLDVMLRVAWHYLGTPYRWGGDDPSGLDCSGYVIECLKSIGVFPRNQDTTADGLRKMFPQIIPEHVRPGDLVFWMRGDRATHVGIVIDPPDLYLGADGGGSRTQTEDDAWRQNAYIKVRSLSSRGSVATRRFARCV